MLHPFDKSNRMHMEYVRERGVYDDVPFDEIQQEMRRTYPSAFTADHARLDGDFAAEAIALPKTLWFGRTPATDS
jgi:hypothetical protein